MPNFKRIFPISTHLCKKAGIKKSAAKTGSITLIQRFGGSINLNVHFHQLFLDGVYALDPDGRPGEFHITKTPTVAELSEVLQKIIDRTVKLLEKRGLIVRDPDENLQINLDHEDDALARLQAGAATYRFTLGPSKGKKALTLQTVPESDHNSSHGLVAKMAGFSLHAGVAFTGAERDKIEKLARYIARPAVALDRLSVNRHGQVIYRLKKPYADGTTHISMSPLELMERLAAIVPRPRVHLTRFAGVFAPHYKYRSLIVPKSKSKPEIEEPATLTDSPNASKANRRIEWARLLKRVFNIDVETCPKCGGKIRIIAAIEEPEVIKKILKSLGLDTKPPPIMPARGPPDDDFSDQRSFDF